VRVFSDRAYLPTNVDHIWQLSPFWGATGREEESIQPKRLARYIKEGQAILELTSLERAEFALFPAEYQLCDNEERRPFFHDFTRLAASAGKPTIAFTGGDLEHRLPEFNGYEFHTSLYRSTTGKNTFAMPAAIGDIIDEELAGLLPVLSKEPRPSLGFCGFAPPVCMPFGKEMLKEMVRDLLYPSGLLSVTHVGYAPRARAIRALRNSKVIDIDFVLRGNSRFMWAFGYLLKNRGVDDIAIQRREYLKNLLGSPYTLCVRGRGNYSLRFYEALCCGRIPVFVNTDCVLPFENVIKWKDYCVWVEERDIPHIGEILADFHAGISSARFIELQIACRKLWLDYLSPESFIRHLLINFQYSGPRGER
jgi:Exostosin family